MLKLGIPQSVGGQELQLSCDVEAKAAITYVKKIHSDASGAGGRDPVLRVPQPAVLHNCTSSASSPEKDRQVASK
eukprot:scaffold332758_cov43-Prasinocladus_malaysianus.AAC.1